MVFLSNTHFVTAKLTLCSLWSQIEFSTSFNENSPLVTAFVLPVVELTAVVNSKLPFTYFELSWCII